jgi:hypothetical protein
VDADSDDAADVLSTGGLRRALLHKNPWSQTEEVDDGGADPFFRRYP